MAVGVLGGHHNFPFFFSYFLLLFRCWYSYFPTSVATIMAWHPGYGWQDIRLAWSINGLYNWCLVVPLCDLLVGGPCHLWAFIPDWSCDTISCRPNYSKVFAEIGCSLSELLCCGMSLIARFMGPTRGPYGANRTQVGPMLAPWTLLSGVLQFVNWDRFYQKCFS